MRMPTIVTEERDSKEQTDGRGGKEVPSLTVASARKTDFVSLPTGGRGERTHSTLTDEENLPIKELSIERSIQFSSVDQGAGESESFLPETAKFNHLPVELLCLRAGEVDDDDDEEQRRAPLSRAHRKNQISFGKRMSSENTTRVIDLKQDGAVPAQILEASPGGEKEDHESEEEEEEEEQEEEEELVVDLTGAGRLRESPEPVKTWAQPRGCSSSGGAGSSFEQSPRIPRRQPPSMQVCTLTASSAST